MNQDKRIPTYGVLARGAMSPRVAFMFVIGAAAAAAFFIRVVLFDASLDRSEVYGIFMPLIVLLGGVALGALVHGIRELRRLRALRFAGDRDPEHPWLWEYPWNEAGIDDRMRTTWKRGVVIALFFILMLVPFHVVAARAGVDGFGRTVLLLFDVLFLILLVGISRQFAKGRQYGAVRLRFDEFPYRTGEPVKLTLVAGPWLRTASHVRAELRCIEDTWEKWDNGRLGQTRNELVAHELFLATADFDEHELRQLGSNELPMRFDIPSDAPGSALSQQPARYWDLYVKAVSDVKPNYSGRFLIPVYNVVGAGVAR